MHFNALFMLVCSVTAMLGIGALLAFRAPIVGRRVSYEWLGGLMIVGGLATVGFMLSPFLASH